MIVWCAGGAQPGARQLPEPRRHLRRQLHARRHAPPQRALFSPLPPAELAVASHGQSSATQMLARNKSAGVGSTSMPYHACIDPDPVSPKPCVHRCRRRQRRAARRRAQPSPAATCPASPRRTRPRPRSGRSSSRGARGAGSSRPCRRRRSSSRTASTTTCSRPACRPGRPPPAEVTLLDSLPNSGQSDCQMFAN